MIYIMFTNTRNTGGDVCIWEITDDLSMERPYYFVNNPMFSPEEWSDVDRDIDNWIADCTRNICSSTMLTPEEVQEIMFLDNI